MRRLLRTRVSIPIVLALALLAGYVAMNFTPCHQCGARTWKSASRVYEDYDHDARLIWFCPRCNQTAREKYGDGTHFTDLYPYDWDKVHR